MDLTPPRSSSPSVFRYRPPGWWAHRSLLIIGVLGLGALVASSIAGFLIAAFLIVATIAYLTVARRTGTLRSYGERLIHGAQAELAEWDTLYREVRDDRAHQRRLDAERLRLWQEDQARQRTEAAARAAEEARRQVQDEEREKRIRAWRAYQEQRDRVRRAEQEQRERAEREEQEQRARANYEGLVALTPEQFEQRIGDLLERLGYQRVRWTGGPHDGGVDLVCYDANGSKIAVQCKRYTNRNTVSAGAIREFLGAMQSTGAERGIFVTTSNLTQPAEKVARAQHIRVFDAPELKRLLRDAYGPHGREATTTTSWSVPN